MGRSVLLEVSFSASDPTTCGAGSTTILQPVDSYQGSCRSLTTWHPALQTGAGSSNHLDRHRRVRRGVAAHSQRRRRLRACGRLLRSGRSAQADLAPADRTGEPQLCSIIDQHLYAVQLTSAICCFASSRDTVIPTHASVCCS